MRLLILLGYAAIGALLLATLLLELLGDNLSSIYFEDPTVGPRRVTYAVVVIASLAFVMGWALVLTGASDCRRRVFLPVAGLFVANLLELVDLVGTSVSFAMVGLVLLLVAVPAAAHLFTGRLRYWRDFALFEFCIWLAVGSTFIFFSWFLGAWKGAGANALSDALFLLVFISAPFYFLLGLDVVDLAVDVSRMAVLGLRRSLPGKALLILTLLVPLAQPVILVAFISATRDKALYSVWHLPVDVVLLILGLLASSAVVVGILRLVLLRRWTVQAAAPLLTLSLASLLLVLGISLAYQGSSFIDLGLSLISVIPPAFLFVGLIAYDVLNFGARFANTEGRIMPRTGRALMYLGSVILVVGYSLFFMNVREVPFGETEAFTQRVVGSNVALGILFLGPLYLAWTAGKHQERLIGDDSDSSSQSTASEDYASGGQDNQGWGVLGVGVLYGLLGYFATLIPYMRVISSSISLPRFGPNWGTVVLMVVVVSIAIASGVSIRYVRGTLSADMVKLLVGAVVGYILSYMFMGFG
jgi:hypothetical protein